MLFNSYEFIFIVLPISMIIYYVLGRLNKKYAQIELIIVSLIFYGYWNFKYIPLIIMSILINFYGGIIISKNKRGKLLLIIGIVFNLGLLGYYKYLNFFLMNVNNLLGTNYKFINIVLPLGISFYTFQQIAYIVDCYKNKSYEKDVLSYSLCILFFAKVSQGPIAYYKDLVLEFKEKKSYKINFQNLNKGIFYFSIGIFKKIMIADVLAKYVSPGFDMATSLTFIEAWGIALSYTLQLYFDFSGYTDMAIGIGYFFNIKLPQNFDSPYQANNIIDFWRKWHITLGDFLKNYVYIPLGGNRRGTARKYLNLLIIMILCGLWHGASWTFILWGGLHGIFLIINNIVRKLKVKIHPAIGRVLTFLSVMLAWVLFRAKNFHTALEIYKGMIGCNGVKLSNLIYFNKQALFISSILLFIVMFVPNPRVIYKKWSPNIMWMIILLLMLLFSIMNLNKPTEFLYFQF